jgi:hypothetical protein
MNPKNKLAKIRQRSTFAAKGAFVGAFVGGIFGRKAASVGAGLGASLGVLVSDKKNSTSARREALSAKKNDVLNREKSAPTIETSD